MSSSINATGSSERIPSLDFLRGIAILGILFINTENFAYPDSWSPGRYGFETPVDHATRFWVYFLTQGKFYSMFALLFGVGFYIFLERLRKKGLGLKAMDIYARRMLWLFVMGIVHAYLIWNGDILYHYAICGLLLIPFRSLTTRQLVFVLVLLCTLLLARSFEQAKRRQGWQQANEAALTIPEDQRTEEDLKHIAFWNEITSPQKPDTASIQTPKSTYWVTIKENYEHTSAHKGLLYYQGLLFSTLMLMIMGIILFRSGIFTDYRVWKHYWIICLGILGVGLVINYVRYFHWTYNDHEPILNIWE
ncbi:MAG TPA: hypothetical protein DIU20_14710, partial [Cryomorphaceae bacterium]|nr:hypothetical protein [Cryomorphaceae bacterium]